MPIAWSSTFKLLMRTNARTSWGSRLAQVGVWHWMGLRSTADKP